MLGAEKQSEPFGRVWGWRLMNGVDFDRGDDHEDSWDHKKRARGVAYYVFEPGFKSGFSLIFQKCLGWQLPLGEGIDHGDGDFDFNHHHQSISMHDFGFWSPCWFTYCHLYGLFNVTTIVVVILHFIVIVFLLFFAVIVWFWWSHQICLCLLPPSLWPKLSSRTVNAMTPAGLCCIFSTNETCFYY